MTDILMRPWVRLQIIVAELRERDGPRELSMAVLTDDQPSHEYAIETVRGVAERLLSRSRGGP